MPRQLVCPSAQSQRVRRRKSATRVIGRLWEERTFALDARMDQLFVIHDRTRDRIGEHRAILDAIRARDATAARRAMRRHLTNIERQRMSILRGGA